MQNNETQCKSYTSFKNQFKANHDEKQFLRMYGSDYYKIQDNGYYMGMKDFVIGIGQMETLLFNWLVSFTF